MSELMGLRAQILGMMTLSRPVPDPYYLTLAR